MRDWSVEMLVGEFGTQAAGDAWKAFLWRFTPLIIAVARQYPHDEQSLHDCYLFICEKLVDDGFRRLRAWRSRDNIRFSSWLRAVVANLCVDWQRSVQGRQRPFRSLAHLSEPERLVFRHHFEFGESIRETHAALVTAFPQLRELDVAAIIRRINRLLKPQQHWMLASRPHQEVSLDNPAIRHEAELSRDAPETPEDLATQDQQHERLQAALRQLSTQQRLLLKLRYQQGLSLKEVARLTGHTNLQQARYQIELALERLRVILSN